MMKFRRNSFSFSELVLLVASSTFLQGELGLFQGYNLFIVRENIFEIIFWSVHKEPLTFS